MECFLFWKPKTSGYINLTGLGSFRCVFLKTKTAPPGVDGGAEPTRGSFQDPSGASRVTALCETENPKSHMDGASSSGVLWGGRFLVVFPGTNQPGNQF